MVLFGIIIYLAIGAVYTAITAKEKALFDKEFFSSTEKISMMLTWPLHVYLDFLDL